MSEKTGIILLGRGGYSDAPSEQMKHMVDALLHTQQYAIVQGAFIDHGSPSLPEALSTCITIDLERVLIVPVYLPADRNLQQWFTRVMKRWLHQHPQAKLDLHMAEPLGDAPEVTSALLTTINRYLESLPELLSPNQVNPNSPEWSVIPLHQYHVLMCRGPRCNTAGAGEISERLKQRLKEENLLDNDVLLAQTGCLFPCNLGPMMVVYPDAVWYGGLTEMAVDRIVEEHLSGGEIVEHYAHYPAEDAQQRPNKDILPNG